MNVNSIPDTGAAWAAAVASVAVTRPAATRPAGEPNHDQLKAAVVTANPHLAASGQRMEMSWDQDSRRVVVKLVDSDTREIIRQLPTEEALSLAKRLAALADHFSAEA
ncbi:MAG: flagellar protein FlaG [Betaproteobacteria bacterium]|nr:flagellar protein FlaG [Betaproteobacteria bacterium]